MLRLAGLALLALLIGSASSRAACTTYADPTTRSVSDFIAGGFGAIAIRRPGVSNRMLVFDKSSCYDIAYLHLPDLNIALNNRNDSAGPSFLAANVIKAYGYPMGGEPPFQVKFRRKANAVDSTDKWVRADDEDKLREGGRFNGAFGIVLDREFEPADKLPFATLSEFLAFKKLVASDGLLADWHAVIVPVTDSGRLLYPDASYTVLQNTRFGIDPLSADGIDLTAAPKGTIISQLQLVKFARLVSPAKPVDALRIEVERASCLYMRYRIDGENEVFLKEGNIAGDYLVLRLKKDAAC